MIVTGEIALEFPGRAFNLKVVEDVDSLLDTVTTDDDVPFWAVLWPAAIGMAEYFWENVDFTGQQVLELGAGLGLAGIAAAAKGAALVQTDFIPAAMKLAQENARLNGIDNIKYRLADWRQFSVTEQFDWIIGSDILYEPKLHSSLAGIFKRNLRPGGTIALADPGRDYGSKFVRELASQGYRVDAVTRSVYEAGRDVKVSLYFLTKL